MPFTSSTTCELLLSDNSRGRCIPRPTQYEYHLTEVARPHYLCRSLQISIGRLSWSLRRPSAWRFCDSLSVRRHPSAHALLKQWLTKRRLLRVSTASDVPGLNKAIQGRRQHGDIGSWLRKITDIHSSLAYSPYLPFAPHQHV